MSTPDEAIRPFEPVLAVVCRKFVPGALASFDLLGCTAGVTLADDGSASFEVAFGLMRTGLIHPIEAHMRLVLLDAEERSIHDQRVRTDFAGTGQPDHTSMSVASAIVRVKKARPGAHRLHMTLGGWTFAKVPVHFVAGGA